MNLNWGFVSICLSEHRCSPAGHVTFKQVESLDQEAKRLRIARVARRNLENTLRIMWFLQANDILLYRLSAGLIPLATHDATRGWPWWEESELVELGAKIGRVAARKGYRLSSHLPEMCGFSSDRLFHWTEEYLRYHRRLFDMLALDETTTIVVHVGGHDGDKSAAIERARANLRRLDSWARERIALENDDRTFTAEEVASLAEEVGVRAVFDWHHHVCNPGGIAGDGEELTQLLRKTERLWHDRPLKVHVSSPKNERQVRAHADFVDLEFALPFFHALETCRFDEVDVMVEAKKKDLALIRLRDELQKGAAVIT